MKTNEKGFATYKEYPVSNNGRINFSKISGTTPLPYLVEIQTKSFNWFINEGVDEVMKEVFPIENHNGKYALEYVGCRFEEPKYNPLQCKEMDQTYSSKLKVSLRIKNNEVGTIREASEVFMGDIPMMTESGTFIINGSERVIVSQIVRSPGAYFQNEVNKAGHHKYDGEIIPNRGTWLQFESDMKDIMWVRIDRQRKMPATILFKALGIVEDDELKRLFGTGDLMQNTLAKDKESDNQNKALIEIFTKLKPGEPVTKEACIRFLKERFFDDKRYDLGRAGRYKYNQKLGIYDRLIGRILAEPLIDGDGEVICNEDGEPMLEGYKLTKNDVKKLRNEEVFENGAMEQEITIDTEIDDNSIVNVIKVHAFDKPEGEIVPIVGTNLNSMSMSRVMVSDMVACFNYFNNIQFGIGQTDDIDHLGNRRVRCIGELLQTQFRIGLTKMERNTIAKMSIEDPETCQPRKLINIRSLTSSIHEFFSSGQLSQFMDQTNPLAELTNKRRISALGPGGLTRDRASMEVRDVHYTHYGRICPIETPEGQNIGLINNLSTYAKINNYGFIETPYRIVVHQKDEDGVMHHYVLDEAEYLSADAERGQYIAEADIKVSEPKTLTIDGEIHNNVKEILDDEVVCRHGEDNTRAPREYIDYVDVSPKQIISIAAACIPFLENDDGTRALMGANMQRQALPLLKPTLPYVGTGMEPTIAKDSGLAKVSKAAGVVKYVDSSTILVQEESGNMRRYDLEKFQRANGGTCINQTPIVKEGDVIEENVVIADGPAMRNGELALGQNVLIAYMTWHGYNYEDAIIMSERMVKDDTYTTIHIEKFELECRDTKLGKEEFTRDIPNVSEQAKQFLDENGVIIKGAEVKEGDILVGKTTPKGQSEPTPEEKLLAAIFDEKSKEGKDSSLRVPHGAGGIVLDVKTYTRKNKDPLPPGVQAVVRVYIVQKRKISEGDKMSGRHGNKGVISKILPVEDMPFLPSGRPVDILLSPMGVPSRMNIGQISEVHLGLACEKLGMRIATPAFDGVSNDEILELMNKAGISSDGKSYLYDGQTGERFAERISVGIQYMIKLVHMVDDKIHARATGPYSLVTQQPLGGKAQKGGQRFGEMEVWALEAYGAAHTLQEMMTIKSDDRVGRRKTYESIIKMQPFPRPGMPEAFKVVTKEMRGLGMRVDLYDEEGHVIDLNELAQEALEAERKVNASIHRAGSTRDEQPVIETVVEEETTEEE